MIEKFNFYDVYGYFLPGATLLGLLWLPFVVVQHLWPATALSSAIAIIALSYIVGHIIQTLGSNAFPSKTRDAKKVSRYPSDILLDTDDRALAPETKQQIGEQVRTVFHLEVETDKYGGEAAISKRRSDAFFLCRAALISGKIAAYPEQFEAMYALMRGLALAFWLGAFQLAGWAASASKDSFFTEQPLRRLSSAWE